MHAQKNGKINSVADTADFEPQINLALFFRDFLRDDLWHSAFSRRGSGKQMQKVRTLAWNGVSGMRQPAATGKDSGGRQGSVGSWLHPQALGTDWGQKYVWAHSQVLFPDGLLNALLPLSFPLLCICFRRNLEPQAWSEELLWAAAGFGSGSLGRSWPGVHPNLKRGKRRHRAVSSVWTVGSILLLQSREL